MLCLVYFAKDGDVEQRLSTLYSLVVKRFFVVSASCLTLNRTNKNYNLKHQQHRICFHLMSTILIYHMANSGNRSFKCKHPTG